MATIGATAALTPSRRAAESLAAINLEAQIPRQFADWLLDTSIVPVLPDPETQASLDKIYTQTLARTYVNSKRQRVMLTIAYGADQGSDATQVHRPEICYAAQGFSIEQLGTAHIEIEQLQLKAARLVGRRGEREEYITYWVTLNDTAVLPGLARRLTEIRIGLAGMIPDGLLFRSSIVGLGQADSFRLQDAFLWQLYKSLASPVRARYYGR